MLKKADNNHDKKVDKNKKGHKKIILLSSAGLVIIVVFAIITNFFILPKIAQHNAQKDLNQLSSQKGDITVWNDGLVSYSGDKIDNTNTDQKALAGTDGIAVEPPSFVFTNGKQTAAKTVDIYLDFSSQKSRDTFLVNKNMLKNLVEYGTIKLKIHPVVTSDMFSTYAAESISEVSYASPTKTWDFATQIMDLSANISDKAPDNVANEMAKIAQNLSIKLVTSDAIKNGTFSSWIYSSKNDPILNNGNFELPIIRVNDTTLDPNKVNFNDINILQSTIVNQK